MRRDRPSWPLLLLFGGLLAGCGGEKSLDSVPPKLLGTWVTTNSRYADRSFSLSGDRFIVDTGDGPSATHRIGEILELQQDDGRVLYVIRYRSERVDQQFAFYYDARRDVVTPKNQAKLEWTRKGTGT